MNTIHSVSAGNSSPIPVADQATHAGQDVAADVQRISDSGNSTRITTAATTLVVAGRGVLKRLLVEATLTGTATIYDNTSAAGTILTILPIGFPAGSHDIGINFSTGLTVVTSAADRIVPSVGL